MNAKQIHRLLINEGWIIKNQNGSHRQYIHMTRMGKVTVPIHGKNEININTLKSIFKQAGIKKII
jgi:predicted RNA binding protein YcfA (HicA-like mRNA interferase family)